jgi:hypothetical protein
MKPQASYKTDSALYRAFSLLPTAILLAAIFAISAAHWALLL